MNIKHRITDFKVVEMIEKTKKKRKTKKPKLLAVSNKGKSSENTATVSSKAQTENILGHTIPLKTVFPSSKSRPQTDPQPEQKVIPLSSNTPSSSELDKETSEVVKVGIAKNFAVKDPDLLKIIDQGNYAIDNLIDHLSPDTLNCTPIKQIPPSTKPLVTQEQQITESTSAMITETTTSETIDHQNHLQKLTNHQHHHQNILCHN
jgi:hypothetical protein